MATPSDALAAFNRALDSIESEKREPIGIEDRTFATEFALLRSDPAAAIKALQSLGSDDMRRLVLEKEQLAASVTSIAEWRVKLRAF